MDEICSTEKVRLGANSNDDDLARVVEPSRKRECVEVLFCIFPAVESDDVNAVAVIGRDLCLRLFSDPTRCCCCRLLCKADNEDEPPTSAVLPNEDTRPIAASRESNMVAAIGKYIGLPLHSSFIVKDTSKQERLAEHLDGMKKCVKKYITHFTELTITSNKSVSTIKPFFHVQMLCFFYTVASRLFLKD